MLKFTELEKAFEEAIALNFKYIGVKIRNTVFSEDEITIIPRVNFEQRLAFYKATMDSNCSSYPEGEVQIVDVDYEDYADALKFFVE